MLSLVSSPRILLCLAAVELRKSFDGLAATVQLQLGLDPFAGHWFVFHNKSGDRLKILTWQADGWAIWYKNQAIQRPGTNS